MSNHLAAPVDARAASARAIPFAHALHPGTLFLAVWGAVLGTWALIPESTFTRLTSSQKYVSSPAIAFFVSAVCAFIIGTLVGPLMFHARGSSRRDLGDLATPLTLFRRRTSLLFVLGAAATIYTIAAGTLRAGGPSALLTYIANGGSWSRLAQNYFRPARISLVTAWLHLLVAIGPLAVEAAVAAGKGRIRGRQIRLVFLGFLLTAVISFAFAERLVVFAFVVGSAVAWLGVGAVGFPRKGQLKTRSLLRILLTLGLMAGIWITSEFSRTYLAQRSTTTPIGVSDIRAGTPLAADRFIAYVITSANNGMYAVDHFQSQQFVYSSLSVFITSLGLDNERTPIVGPGITELNQELNDLYPYNNPLTTFSLPGYAFMDLGWGGVVLLFWFGAAIGAVFARFKNGELWALAIYPLLAVGILDSYRIMYWTRTEMVVPVLGVAFVMAAVYGLPKPRRDPQPENTVMSSP